ncbi:MAG: hypothetical protein SFV15_19430 [Polyangiaceae bacterium]|nr:hypothetical protein [Polyangiaceae bacterium]
MMYLPLPGRGASIAGKSTLWLGEHHLMLLHDGWLRQKYRRFAYSDICGLQLQLHRGQAWRGGAFSVVGLICLLVAIVAPFEFKVVAVVLLALALFGVGAELVRGPHCRVWLSTAVGDCKLPSLCRVRTAEKALAEIIPRIEAAQGRVDPGQLEHELARLSPPSLFESAAAPGLQGGMPT